MYQYSHFINYCFFCLCSISFKLFDRLFYYFCFIFSLSYTNKLIYLIYHSFLLFSILLVCLYVFLFCNILMTYFHFCSFIYFFNFNTLFNKFSQLFFYFCFLKLSNYYFLLWVVIELPFYNIVSCLGLRQE